MLEKIIRKYYDEIFLYCCHHAGSRTAGEDLCQDTFMSFIEHYKDYHHMGKTKNYLYTIAGNKCRDYRKKHTPVLMEELPEQKAEGDLEDSVILRQLLSSLPEEQLDLRYTDIAFILKISPSLAKYRVKKGLELLSAMEGGKL